MQPNIVWITLDSLRADHTTLHGYDRDTTTAISEFAASGNAVNLKQCFTHGIDTAASSASIFTGTYPSYHRVNIGDNVGTIPSQLDTIPELLGQNGYRTACVTRNPRLDLIGADRGFDQFHEVSYSSLLQPGLLSTSLKYGLNIRRHSAGFSLDKMDHSLTYVVNDIAKQWLDSLSSSEPFFCYLHYNEPHRPYHAPLSYLDRYTDDLPVTTPEAAAIARDIHENAYDYVANDLPLSETDWNALKAMYDAAVAYTDRQVGKILDYLETLALDDTIVVITADHGELFGEGGYLAHQFLVRDELTNVPLVISGLEGVDRHTDSPVQHGDVMRTLLEVAGVDIDTEQFGGTIDLRSDRREFAVSQADPTFDYIRDSIPTSNRVPPTDRSQRAFGRRGYKLVHSEGRTELFDLPDEEHDVSGVQGWDDRIVI